MHQVRADDADTVSGAAWTGSPQFLNLGIVHGSRSLQCQIVSAFGGYRSLSGSGIGIHLRPDVWPDSIAAFSLANIC
jgi:hypothetical protein